jgi:translocation and assembly module TamB
VARGLSRTLAVAAAALLAGLALAGLAVAGVAALSASSAGQAALARLVNGRLHGLFAGRLTADALRLSPRGAVELRGVRLRTPEGEVAVEVPRALVLVDLRRLGRRELRLEMTLDGPSVLLDEAPDGTLGLVRALSPAQPSPPGAPAAAEAVGGRPWRIEVARLAISGGAFRWRRQDGSARVAADGIELAAVGAWAAPELSARLRLRAALEGPVEGPLTLDGAARLDGERLDVSRLEVALGATRAEGAGGWDFASGAFRAAVTRLGLAAADARRLAPAAPAAADLTGAAYAESDGALATGALDVPAAGAAGDAGAARAAAAVRFGPGAPAAGVDVALAGFDPSRLVAQAPPGRVDLVARGAAAGRAPGDARGFVALDLAPSRLRDREVGPATLAARFADEAVEVQRLEARLPGVRIEGSGRWRPRGAVAAELAVSAPDLGRLRRDLAAVTGLELPPLEGRLDARATLSGTAAAPAVRASLDAPSLRVGDARAERLQLSAAAAGPPRSPRVSLKGRAARAELSGVEAVRVELSAALTGRDASASLAATVPALGREPVALEGAARLDAARTRAELRQLSLAWPDRRFALVRPAVVTFAPAAVDRLELSNGRCSIALSGGLGAREALDARLEVAGLDLARLPHGVLPTPPGLAGVLSADARATGTTRAPRLAAHLALVDGAVRGLSGLQVDGDVRWAARGRLAGAVHLARAEGGVLDASADLPLPLGEARPEEPVALAVTASAWPVEVLRRAAGLATPLDGSLAAHAALSGTAGAPHLEASAALADGAFEDLRSLGAEVALDGAAGALRVVGRAVLGGATVARLEARVPLDAGRLLRQPGVALRALLHGPVTGALELPGLDLAAVTGKVGVPPGLAGMVTGTAALGGTPSAPRGRASLALAGGSWSGYHDVAAALDLSAEAQRTSFSARASLAGAEALRASGALGAPVERLADLAALREAALTLEAVVPGLPLSPATAQALPVSGTLTARASARGTLARPEARVELGGKAVEVKGRPLGEIAAVLRHEGGTTTAQASLRPASGGGALRADATLAAPLWPRDAAELRRAPSKVRVTSEALDLAFLPALAPALVRVASGRLDVDIAAEGPLGGLRPTGTVKLAGGRLAVVELGDWSEVELEASLGERAIEVSRLSARRGPGSLSGTLSARELGTPVAKLGGKVTFRQLPLMQEGVELASLDLPVDLEATLSDERLDAVVTVGAGTIRLPRRASHKLQAMEQRRDIVVEEEERERRRRGAGGASAPLEVRCRVVLPGKLLVRGDKPLVSLELKGDTTWRAVGSELTVDGSVEVVRGTVEPIAGRIFDVERGRVTFQGGPPTAGQLDVVARYDNPSAIVTVTIAGPVTKPSIRLSSQPPMDDAAIAMLIATGRSDVNPNTSGVGTMSGNEAGTAVVGAAMGAAFTGLVGEKLPVDQLSLDSSQLRAGKYLTDKLFVGYTYQFDAKPEENENVNEVRAEYQLGPRWKLEFRYGDAHAGDASVIWSKDY